MKTTSKAKKAQKPQAAPSQARKTARKKKATRAEQMAAVAKVLRVIASIPFDETNLPKELDEAVAGAMEISPRFKEELFEQLDHAEGEEEVQLSSSYCHALYVVTYWLGQRLFDLPHLKARMGLDRKTRLGLVEKTVLIRPELLDPYRFVENNQAHFSNQIEHALELAQAEIEARREQRRAKQ